MLLIDPCRRSGQIMPQHRKNKLAVLDSDMKRFAQWLQHARKSRGFTQDALAECSGVDQGLISKYERAVLPCPKITVYALAEALLPEKADERTARALVNAGLKAAGFATEEEPGTIPMSDFGIVYSPGWDRMTDDERRFYGGLMQDFADNLAARFPEDESAEDDNSRPLPAKSRSAEEVK